jgi:hypothetical protein
MQETDIICQMPYIHWGKEDVLATRDKIIKGIENARRQSPGLPCPRPSLHFPDGQHSMWDFYYDMMAEQLFADHPLHLRRNLHQFYYVHAPTTGHKDRNQVVAKYGPEQKEGGRHILVVDQLWLWIIGGSKHV